MAAVTEKLTVRDFESRFSQEKPYYEFWHGEAVQKSIPNWIHGLLQRIVMEILLRAGLQAASEVRLKIDLDLQLIPDVIANRSRIELPYPTAAVEIVIEILSDDDSMSRMLTKCRQYRNWGFEQILVIDPASRTVFRSVETRLEITDTFVGTPTREIWLALDEALGNFSA